MFKLNQLRHAIGGTEHTASTLAELNSKILDAVLDDHNSPRPAVAHDLGGALHNVDTFANLSSKVSDYALVSKTKARIDLYVRNDIGDDANPGTIVSPLKTLAAAESRIPDIVDHDVVVHLGAHPTTGWVWATLRKRLGTARIIFIGDGAGKPGDDGFTELLSSTAALAGSGLDVIKSSGLPTAYYQPLSAFAPPRGYYFGATIEILTGDAAGDRRDVWMNTATDIIPVCSFTSAVAEGDLYRIVLPSVMINFNYEDRDFCSGFGVVRNDELSSQYGTQSPRQLSSVCLINVFASDGTYPSAYQQAILGSSNTSLLLLGVKFDYGVVVRGSYVRSGVETYWYGHDWGDDPIEGVPMGPELFGAVSNYSWAGWGLCTRSSSSNSYLRIDSCRFTGCVCVNHLVPLGCDVTIEMGCFINGIRCTFPAFETQAMTVRILAYYENIDVSGDCSFNCPGNFLLYSGNKTLRLYARYRVILASRARVKIYKDRFGAGDIILTGSAPGDSSKGQIMVQDQGIVEIIDSLPTIVLAPPGTVGNEFSFDMGATWHLMSEFTGYDQYFGNFLYGYISRIAPY